MYSILRAKGFFITLLFLIILPIPLCAGTIVPMIKFEPGCARLYLYEKAAPSPIHTIKDNCNDLGNAGALNSDSTLYVHGEEWEDGGDQRKVFVYNIASRTTSEFPMTSDMNGPSTGFNQAGKIVFVGIDGILKQMNIDGSNIEPIASPEAPYNFGFFTISPDKSKVAITESYIGECGTYEGCHHQRLLVLDLDTTPFERSIIISDYVGDYNIINWSPDSQNFYYAYHKFVSGGEKTYHTITCEFPIGGIPSVVDISDSDYATLHVSGINVAYYTTSNNLLSVLDKGLYGGIDGELIKDMPCFPDVMGTSYLSGYDEEGIYSCDLDGSDFTTLTGEECPIESVPAISPPISIIISLSIFALGLIALQYKRS